MLLIREFFQRPPEQVAPELLGRVLERSGTDGRVRARITEVEAYSGEGGDPASHAHRGRTARNAAMFGEAGHAYVYFTYGMHHCVNVVCLEPGRAAGVLLRAAEITEGAEAALGRRPGSRPRDLARGPARLTKALGIDREFNGLDLCSAKGPLRLLEGEPVEAARIASGPRTGISAAQDVPWRFYVAGDPTVSTFRAHRARR